MSTYTLTAGSGQGQAVYALIFVGTYTDLLAKFNLKSAVYALISMGTYTAECKKLNGGKAAYALILKSTYTRVKY